ncbi:MAG: Sugar transporter SemiSWEET [Chroococcopsis gigantea SAG 12.99]|jgi:MtN3 and saliva related transmembrane protein|nr:SemiSWEET transporter [Chlorogloea purpurea SAG 13.99]MDV2999344.1 Sugar transporter SemiSWEET [Chroococcopsis gigantea SAG 12.99]
MNSVNIIGTIAGILTTISFLPQVIHTWKTRSAKDISLGMFLCFSSGVFLWMVYGICINNIQIIVPNLITLVLAVTILRFKLLYG